jgi:hypothetical protein
MMDISLLFGLLMLTSLDPEGASLSLKTVDIGAAGDEEYVVMGFHSREGPHPSSTIPIAAQEDFRWTANEFALRIPAFTGKHNEIRLRMYLNGGMKLDIGDGYRRSIFGVGNHQQEYVFAVPAEVVGASEQLVVRGSAVRPREPSATDARILLALIDRVTVRPIEKLPTEDDIMEVPANVDIPTLDRIRGVERRPAASDVEEFVDRLVAERANVVTLGAMNGPGFVFFPSQFGTPHPQMDPDWLPNVIRELRANNIKPLCWIVFNAQDLRDIESFVPAQRFPDWRMRFIEEPGKEYPPKVGMCLVSSPYIEWYAQVLREAAASDLDGFFFDGFYLGGIPHPARPACTCTYCEKAFAQDTGLELPKTVDWTDMNFKRWVRWRNDRLLKTARYFRSEMKTVNPKITCTFNYNIWPFGGKDWETAIPMWRIDDFGVSQHGYSPRFHEKWMMLGFKCRVGRDMNPAHTDLWRACGFSHTCWREEPDLAWHELEVKTFILAALSHGITPWHSTVEGSVDITARVHADVARREHYFSRDYVANVGVLCSQNTHDFYGHVPGTTNLSDYRDSLLGTWMILSENHVPFEFVFDNQVESAIPADYRILILAKAAALSEQMVGTLAEWIRNGGHLIATADTGWYDEWGEKLADCRLAGVLDLRLGDDRTTRRVGRGRVTWLPQDPGLSYCRSRDAEAVGALLNDLDRASLPFDVEAPPWVVVNMFRSPDGEELWVHLLNVSHLMPNGDSGFRGLDQPPVPAGDIDSGEPTDPSRRSIGAALVPARNIVFRSKGYRIRSARLVMGDRELPVRKNTEMMIPELDLHDILVLQRGHAGRKPK